MTDAPSTSWRPVHGLETISVTLTGLLQRAGVSAVHLLWFDRPESLRGREVSEQARKLTAEARTEYRDRGFGFWDFLFEHLSSADEKTRAGILERALRHSELPEPRIVPVQEFTAKLEAGVYRAIPDRQLISMSSRVEFDSLGAHMRLPMLDFAIKSSESNLPLVLQSLELLGVDGHLYDSGNSYQLIGQTPMSDTDLRVLLARAQLLSPITDHRWIAHQLMSGESSLRVSTEAGGNQTEQVLVAVADQTERLTGT